MLATSKRAAEARATAAMWESECHGLRKSLAVKEQTIERLGGLLKDAGEKQRAAIEAPTTKQIAASEASIKALEERLEEVTGMWKQASKDVRTAKAREEEARREVRYCASPPLWSTPPRSHALCLLRACLVVLYGVALCDLDHVGAVKGGSIAARGVSGHCGQGPGGGRSARRDPER